MPIREQLELKIRELPGLVPGPSRYGHGSAYRAGGREVAHFHGDSRMDIRITRDVIRDRSAEGGFDARVRTRGDSSEWVEVRFSSSRDFPLVLSLLEEAMRANE